MGYPAGRYFSFWAHKDDDGRMDWDSIGCLGENMPPRHGLLMSLALPIGIHILRLRRMGGGRCFAGFMVFSAQIVILGVQNFLMDYGQGGNSCGLCLDVIQRGCWASFVHLGEFCARCRHGIAGLVDDLPHRGGGACRNCLAKCGYLVAPDDDQVKFDGAG